MTNKNRSWDILLINGASGTGKTSISLPLANLYGINLVRVDDFQVFFKACTTPASYPTFHAPKTHNNYAGINALVSPFIDIGKIFFPGLKAVIDDHILENIPMILEGDFILPELSASFDNPRIKTILIYESSREQILQNYLAREGELQEQRTDRSYAHGNWLKDEYSKLGLPVIESRPWDTLLQRVISVLE